MEVSLAVKEMFAYGLALAVAIIFVLLNTFFIEDVEFEFTKFFKQTILLTIFNVALFQCFKEYSNFAKNSVSSGSISEINVEPESILSGPPNFKAYSRKSLYN